MFANPSTLSKSTGPAIHSTRQLRAACQLACSVVVAALCLTLPATIRAQALPDAPSTILLAQTQQPLGTSSTGTQAARDQAGSATNLPPCSKMTWGWRMNPQPRLAVPCREDPLQLVVNPGDVTPLSPTQKLVLAGRATADPFNLITDAGYSAIYVGANAHSAYGPGLKGFGRLAGYSLLGDAQGNFFGIYAIPVLAHEDPRYHRLPNKSVKTRILHALVHTVVSQHDNGTLMPNYATLLTYPISAELSNRYVPGIDSSGGATTKRIVLGYVTDPSGALIAEFLPDVAKRIHIHIVFVQQILLQVENKSNMQQ